MVNKGYKIEPISTAGILYQPIGTIHPVDSNYKLVTFVNTSILDHGHDDIISVHVILEAFCQKYVRENPSTSIRNSCEWMMSSTTSMLHQIDQVKKDILGALGTEYQPTRSRRGLFNIAGRVTKVPFGVCSDEDADFLHKAISKLVATSGSTLNIVAAQTRVVGATIADVNATMAPILEARLHSETAIRRLYAKIGQANAVASELETREILIEQVTVINLLLTQKNFEVQKLLQIINSAIHGQIHPNLMSHHQYEQQLREIQLNLPVGLNLPFSLDKFSMTLLIHISQVSVIFIVGTLIFSQTIPLINSNSYKAYTAISFLILQQGNISTFMHQSIQF